VTDGEGPGLDLDRFLPYQVSLLAARLSAALSRVYAERFGITIPEWRVIAHLSQHRKVSVREVQARVGMDKSKVSRAAARLELAGLVEKRVNAGDRRLVELSLTRKGRRLFAEIAPLALAFEADLVAALPAVEAEAFRSAVAALLARTEGIAVSAADAEP
jgi:DNA-binding MarR family transcriptional regulator